MNSALHILTGRRFRAFAYALLLPFVFQVQPVMAEPEHAAAHAAQPEAPAVHGAETPRDATAAEGHEAEAGHHESSGGLPQLNPATFPTQIFWLFVTFGVMYFLFSRKSLPEISGVIENRRQHIDSDLDAAQKLREEADRLQQAYEEGLDNARQQSTQAFMDVEQAMKDKGERTAKEFHDRSAAQLEKADKAIASAKTVAMEEMNTLAAEIARKAAEKIIGVETDIKQAKDVVKSIHDNRAKAA